MPENRERTNRIVLISVILAAVIQAVIGLTTQRQSTIITAVGLAVAAFVLWRKSKSQP